MDLLDARLWEDTQIPGLIELDLDADAEVPAGLLLSIDPTKLQPLESLHERIKSADIRLAAA
jgi:hypothetical protein